VPKGRENRGVCPTRFKEIKRIPAHWQTSVRTIRPLLGKEKKTTQKKECLETQEVQENEPEVTTIKKVLVSVWERQVAFEERA